jgi:hypothetical protein
LWSRRSRVRVPSLTLKESPARHQLPAHLGRCPDNEVLDFVDAVFQMSAHVIDGGGGADPAEEPERLGEEVNSIFAEEGIGYRWVAGKIVRFDEGFTHEQAIKPAIELLAGGGFGAANEEFGAAVDAYRAERWRDAITNANAAFESVLKVVTGKPNLAAADLIREAKREGVIPGYLEASAENLERLMHAIPAARGQQGSAHGLGEKPVEADQHLAQLVLSLAAAFILFIARDASDP